MVLAKSGVEGNLVYKTLWLLMQRSSMARELRTANRTNSWLTWQRITRDCLLQRQRNVLLTSFTPTRITAGRDEGAIGVPRDVTSAQLCEH